MKIYIVRFWCNGDYDNLSVHSSRDRANVALQREVGKFKASTPDIRWEVESIGDRECLFDRDRGIKFLQSMDVPDTPEARDAFKKEFEDRSMLYFFHVEEMNMID